MLIRFFLCGVLAAVLGAASLAAPPKPSAATKAKPAATQTVVLDVVGMH